MVSSPTVLAENTLHQSKYKPYSYPYHIESPPDNGDRVERFLTAFGVVSQRMSLSMWAMRLPEGARYVPSMLEVAIAFAIPAAAGLIYFLFTENLAVLQESIPEHRRSPYARPRFDQRILVYADDSLKSTFARRSRLAVLIIALTIAVLPPGIVMGQSLPRPPVRSAQGWATLLINGNRDETQVNFDHLAHQERLQESVAVDESACLICHHLSKPNDEATPCWECHQDMALPTSIFDHTLHQTALGGNVACAECHAGEHMPDTAKPCLECHQTMKPGAGQATFNYMAPGYTDAMHAACVTCHEQEAEAQARPELAQCSACHQLDENAIDLQSDHLFDVSTMLHREAENENHWLVYTFHADRRVGF